MVFDSMIGLLTLSKELGFLSVTESGENILAGH